MSSKPKKSSKEKTSSSSSSSANKKEKTKKSKEKVSTEEKQAESAPAGSGSGASGNGGTAAGAGGGNSSSSAGYLQGGLTTGGAGAGGIPFDLLSNRVLTHFDETAGVALGRQEVDSHLAMGHIVTPLTEAYRLRYERLRQQLTTRLYPKRESLLSIRRQLLHLSTTINAKKQLIEKETLQDCEEILERLKTVESLRQSSVKHEILQLEGSLQDIERIVKRVERANLPTANATTTATPSSSGGSGSGSGTAGPWPEIVLTSAQPGNFQKNLLEGYPAPKAIEMVELIHEFPDLNDAIEKMAQMQVSVQMDFPMDDFPREVKDRFEILQRCDRFQYALQIKDQLLYSVLQENEQLKAMLQEEKALTADYANEIGQWAQLAQEWQREKKNWQENEERLRKKIMTLQRVMRQHNLYAEDDF
eukprot:scaffold2863_cov139-Ochromonas_danica.AAC.1